MAELRLLKTEKRPSTGVEAALEDALAAARRDGARGVFVLLMDEQGGVAEWWHWPARRDLLGALAEAQFDVASGAGSDDWAG